MVIEFVEKTFASLTLRLGLAAIFIYHGLHLIGTGGAPWYPNAHVAMHWGLFVCGALLLVGLFTRLAALAAGSIIVVAVYMQKWANQWPKVVTDLEYSFALVAMCLALVILGAGAFAIDAMIGTVIYIGRGRPGATESRGTSPRREKSGFLN